MTIHLLPAALISLLNVLLVSAQTRQLLALNSVARFNSSGSGPFVIPSQSLVTVSVAACTQNAALRFYLSNESGSASPSPGGLTTTEILTTDGLGSITNTFENGGVLAVEGTGSFEIALSTSGQAQHEVSRDIPLFGDTTSNQAILFSPPFSPPTPLAPTFPNYTMYPVDIPQDTPPSSFPNYTLSLFPTTQTPFPRTGCFLSTQSQVQVGSPNLNQSLWLKDLSGWRSQYLVGGLTPSTNYTAFLVVESTKVLGPIYFATKSASFPCPLVANLPYCPGVAYAMPLDAPPNNAVMYTGDNMPQALSDPVRSYLTNFTVTLNSFACGRDMYSPLVSCLDCQVEYRKWLCAISLPRCSEPSPANPSGVTAVPAEPTVTGLSATKNEQQQVLSALLPYQTSTPPRNEFLPSFGSPYQMLLPCIESCTAMDRACPAFLGIKCPTAQFNGAASYGIGYIDGKDGDEKEGLTGTAQDRYGNVWCQLGS